MSAEIIVCPDCGQRYDPEKASRVRRVGSRSGRLIKPARAHAQDVRSAAHKRGVHHALHVDQTRLIRECRRSNLIASTAVPLEEIEDDATTMDDKRHRAFARRVLEAARMVERTSFPWWVCWLTVNGYSSDEIAQGISPTRDLFAGYRPAVTGQSGELFDRSVAR